MILAFTLLVAAILTGCAPAIESRSGSQGEPHLGWSHFRAADGSVLPLRTWRPESEPIRAVILALHGFNDHSHAFSEPGRFLVRKGMIVYAYDQRGFGLSPGRGRWPGIPSYLADLEAVSRRLRQRHPGVPLYLLGESMGGAVAIAALTSPNPPPVEGLILSAPAIWSREMMPWYQSSLLALMASTWPELEVTGSGLRVRASDNIEMLRGMFHDPLVIKSTRVDAIDGLTDLMDIAQERAGELRVPILVLYGRNDQIIPGKPVRALLRKLPRGPDTRLALYPEGYHLLLRDLQAEKPLADLAAWATDRHQPLPSGFEYPVDAAF